MTSKADKQQQPTPSNTPTNPTEGGTATANGSATTTTVPSSIEQTFEKEMKRLLYKVKNTVDRMVQNRSKKMRDQLTSQVKAQVTNHMDYLNHELNDEITIQVKKVLENFAKQLQVEVQNSANALKQCEAKVKQLEEMLASNKAQQTDPIEMITPPQSLPVSPSLPSASEVTGVLKAGNDSDRKLTNSNEWQSNENAGVSYKSVYFPDGGQKIEAPVSDHEYHHTHKMNVNMGPYDNSTTSTYESPLQKCANYRTKPCKYFSLYRQSGCNNGDRCTFLHGTIPSYKRNRSPCRERSDTSSLSNRRQKRSRSPMPRPRTSYHRPKVTEEGTSKGEHRESTKIPKKTGSDKTEPTTANTKDKESDKNLHDTKKNEPNSNEVSTEKSQANLNNSDKNLNNTEMNMEKPKNQQEQLTEKTNNSNVNIASDNKLSHPAVVKKEPKSPKEALTEKSADEINDKNLGINSINPNLLQSIKTEKESSLVIEAMPMMAPMKAESPEVVLISDDEADR